MCIFFIKLAPTVSDKAAMVENRLHPRYSCSRIVEAHFFKALRSCGASKAVVTDISKGGLLLRFDHAPPQCDHLVVNAIGHALAYQIRHAYQRDGAFFTGVELVK